MPVNSSQALTNVRMHFVRSSFIKFVGWSAREKTLVVAMKDGKRYQYSGELFGLFGGLLKAKAPGKTFQKVVKNAAVCVRVA